MAQSGIVPWAMMTHDGYSQLFSKLATRKSLVIIDTVIGISVESFTNLLYTCPRGPTHESYLIILVIKSNLVLSLHASCPWRLLSTYAVLGTCFVVIISARAMHA